VEDREYYAEEEEVAAEEGANRTFTILVAALGGILALGICAFVAWAFLLGPQMRADREAQNQAILATNTAVAATATAEMETAEAPPTATETTAPTDTPTPRATPTKPPTATAAPATPAEVAEAATATARPTATPRPVGQEGVPDTGVGMLGAGALAVGLVFLLIVVRRMRRAAS
jgi:cytoskeletal protein RodZ